MTGPVVSIITPTYNHERFIEACIQSVLSQTYTDWEMIIVDDGSTDSTAERARQIGDPRIRILAESHRGIERLSETYNLALRSARGRLIAVLEGDDVWAPDRLERQVPVFTDPLVVLVFGPWLSVTEDGRPTGGTTRHRNRRQRALMSHLMNRPVGTALRVLLAQNPFHSSTVLLDREALERIGGFQQPAGFPAIDYPTWLNLALEGEFRFIDAPMGYWRLHRGQYSSAHALELTKGARAYALRFYGGLSPQLQMQSGWTEARLRKVMDREKAITHGDLGRRSLLAGDRRAANKHFMAALLRGTGQTRAKAAVGLFCGVAGVDFERVAALLGRTPWK